MASSRIPPQPFPREGDVRRASDTAAMNIRGYDTTHKRFSSLPLYQQHQQHHHVGDGHLPPRRHHPSQPSEQLLQAKLRLEHAFVRDRLSQKLERRPNVETLVQHNILKAEHIAPSLMRTQKQLHQSMAADKLTHLLEKRQNLEELEHQNILRDIRVAPSLQGVQRRLSLSLARSNLYHALKHRPSRQSLEAHGILPIAFEDADDHAPFYFYSPNPPPFDIHADLQYQQQPPPLQSQQPLQPQQPQPDLPTDLLHRSSVPPSTATPHGPNFKPRAHSQPISPVSYSNFTPGVPQQQQQQPTAPNFHPNHMYYQHQIDQIQHYDNRSKNLTFLLLKFVKMLTDSGDISQEQKGSLKDLILASDPKIVAAAEVFELDKDVDEFKDTIVRVARRLNPQ